MQTAKRTHRHAPDQRILVIEGLDQHGHRLLAKILDLPQRIPLGIGILQALRELPQ